MRCCGALLALARVVAGCGFLGSCVVHVASRRQNEALAVADPELHLLPLAENRHLAGFL